MKTADIRAFVDQVLFGLLVTIAFGGTIGLGTVWMRHQVSVVADTNADLQQEYERVLRRLADTSALVETAMNFDVLRAQNQAMHLGLVELSQQQIQPVVGDPVRRLVARANRRMMEREAASGGVGIQLPFEPAAVGVPASAESSVPLSAAAARPHGRSDNFQFAFGQ